MSRGERYREAYLLGKGTGRRRGYRGFWVEWYRLMPAGSLRRERACFPSKLEARQFRARKTSELNAPLFGLFDWDTMVDAFSDAIATRAGATQIQYLGTLTLLREALGRKPLAHELTPAALQRFVARLCRDAEPGGGGTPRPRGRRRVRSPRTVHKHIRHLRAFISFGLQQEPPWFARDPSRGLRVPAAVAGLVRAPSIDDVAGLLARCPTAAWYVAVRAAFETGLRAQDLVTLAWTHLRYEKSPLPRGGQVLVINRVQGKTQAEKVWVCTPGLEAAIETLRETAGDGQRVLGWAEFPRAEWDAIKSAGLRFHGLRAAAATYARHRAAGVKVAQRMLDHSSGAVTRRHYLDALAEAAGLARCLARAALPSWSDVSAAAATRARPADTPARGAAGH